MNSVVSFLGIYRKQRVAGFELAKALAIFGMVIVNFRIAMNAEIGNLLLVDFAELFESRVSTLFVILAAVGASLLITVQQVAQAVSSRGSSFSRKRLSNAWRIE